MNNTADINVLLTVPDLDQSSGGPARTVPDLAHALGSLGASVTLATVKTDHPTIPGNQESLPYKVNFFHTEASRPAARELSKFIRDSQTAPCQLVHDNGIWSGFNFQVTRNALKQNLPLVISPRGMLEPWALKQKKWKKRLAWWLYQRALLNKASVIHATAKEEAVHFRSLGLNNPIAVIPNGINLPEFKEHPSNPQKKQTALFISRIHRKKGLLNLVEAWPQLPQSNWEMIIAGPDEDNHRREVERAISLRGLQNCFKFVGPVNDVEKWALYHKADLFILPTFSENFGVVVAEALACGLPVITTRGAPWQTLETHRCGWWIDIGIEPLTRALNEAFTTTPQERNGMGRRGRKLVEEQFSINKVAADMLQVYQWIIGRTKPPPCLMLD